MKIIKQVMIGLLVMFLIAPALDLTPCAAENAPDGESPQVNEKSSKMVYNETMKEPGRQKAVDSRSFDHETPHGSDQSGHPGSTTTAPSAAIPGADNLVNTYYIYSYDGKLLCEYDHNGNCVKDYIYIGNRLFAEYHPQTDKYYYYTIDQVNSTRVITDDNGNVVYSAAYGPYGQIQKIWTNTYDPKLKYSGKEREGYSHLDYFGARYYDHRSYRFTSPDPVFNRAALSNPQLWNLYSYCRNNPITYHDPDGREEKKSIWKQLKEAAGKVAPKGMLPQTMWVENLEEAPKTTDEAVDKAVEITIIVGGAVVVIELAADAMKGGGGRKAADSGKNEPHGDGGRAMSKSERQIQELKEKMKTAKGTEKKRIGWKIDKIRKSAQKAKKGDTDHRVK